MKFLFDLGGVFFDWDPKYFFKSVFEDQNEMNYFLTNICNDEWNIKQDAGRSIEKAEEQLTSKFPNYSNKIRLYYSNHRKMIKGTYLESINALESLKKRNIKSYVLSNWSAETFIGMKEEYPFLKLFEDIIISGEVKMIKPDSKIYQLAIDKFNLNPNKTVFIDDKLININAAAKIGFKTIHLTNPDIIRNEIESFL